MIGRHGIPETDVYSVCLAVENLWLAARAEGLGVGWVSLMRVAHLRKLLNVPAHVLPVAYLCIGYPEDLPPLPELEQAGWRRRVPLQRLVHHEGWGRRDPGRPPHVMSVDRRGAGAADGP